MGESALHHKSLDGFTSHSSWAAAVMHGNDRMPTKYGVPLVEIWQGLGVIGLGIPSTNSAGIRDNWVGIYLSAPAFSGSSGMFDFRVKLASSPLTMELIWCPYAGDAHIISGFVHPPTEIMFK